MSNAAHISVMPEECMRLLQPAPGGQFVDGTLGAGGHSEMILERIAPNGKLTSFDLDPDAIAIASERLSRFGDRIHIIHDSYTQVGRYIPENSLDGFLLDLGVSSMQLDRSEKGFSFLHDGPLDMRFSPDQLISAADIVNQYPEPEIAEILWTYGEERKGRQIAAAICRERQHKAIQTTTELRDIIINAVGGSHDKVHPATRTFQAIRIAVNEELRAIETVLPEAVKVLKPGGRLAVISFHSLEDRIVKQFFKRESRDCLCPPEQLICTCGHKASLKEITRHPLCAEESEISQNSRSRSAKLRAAEKLPLPVEAHE